MTIEVPLPIETFDLTMGDGAVIRVHRRGRPEGVRLFVSNGNGFAVDGRPWRRTRMTAPSPWWVERINRERDLDGHRCLLAGRRRTVKRRRLEGSGEQ